jgi:hypothetical protein
MKKFIIAILLLSTICICKSQTIYTSLMIDPITLITGTQVNILINNIDLESSYSIGRVPWTEDNYINKVIFEEYQIGLGYNFKNNKVILTPFISYNKVNHKYYNTSYGVNILFEINKRLHILTNMDIKIWSIKIGFGIKI